MPGLPRLVVVFIPSLSALASMIQSVCGLDITGIGPQPIFALTARPLFDGVVLQAPPELVVVTTPGGLIRNAVHSSPPRMNPCL